MTIEELKKYKWFVATCKYEGIVGKKHCFTYDVDNLNTNLLSGMILVDDELVKETEEKGIFDYLKGLFTGDIKRIQRYSHIEWSEPFQEEASKMTGFGDMIYERGIQQGRHEGMILGALMSGKTPEEVSKMLNLPLEEIKKVQEQQMTVNK